MMNKQSVLEKIRAKMAEEADTLIKGARLAHEYATDGDSKAENKYDTRVLEASYLAEAQAKLAAETLQSVAAYRALEVREFVAGDRIALTALVELKRDEERRLYFIGPKGGGLTIEHEGRSIVLITPTSPLGQRLLGKQAGDYFDMQTEHAVCGYEIISVS